MAVNVNRSITDPFYRYKMPKLLAKVEGKGNGIKTVITNMTEIAKSLERPAMYPTKFFGCELGAQTNFDSKNERYIVNGEHDANRLQDLLDGFIKKFVLCPACDNPETTLSVRRNQIHSKCKACGHSHVIDSRHKLSSYIVKNPPKIEIDFSKAKQKEVIRNEDDDFDRSSDDIEDDDDWAPAPINDSGKLTAGIGKLVIDKDLEKSENERLDMLEKFFIDARDGNKIGDGRALIDEAERLDVKHKGVIVLALTLLTENILKAKEIHQYRLPLIRFTFKDKKGQRSLLGAVEKLIAKQEKELLPFSAHIVKNLYDEDILEEDAILAWAEKPSSKYTSKTQAKKIVEKCEKFLTWLKEAEEEDDDEEEEEDEEVSFDHRNGGSMPKVEAVASKEDIKVKTDDGHEIDIDDI